ncbi:MAG: hypothetical protein K8T20_01990 [Planctomycetes bacterium]|nr:hypothetical protein [Planctomycetota bacterium]
MTRIPTARAVRKPGSTREVVRSFVTATLALSILGCGTPVEDRINPDFLLSTAPLALEVVQSQAVELPGQIDWDIERFECEKDHLAWFRRGGGIIQIGRIDAREDGSFDLRGGFQSVKVDDDETLDRWRRGPMSGILSRRNPQDSPKDPQVEWSEGPVFVAPMQVRGDFLCVEDRVESPFPPPCGDAFGIVRIYERHGSEWVLLSTIRRAVQSRPKFEVAGASWFLLSNGKGGLEIWSGVSGSGFAGSRLARSGTLWESGLSISNGRPVVAWLDGENRSFVDWNGERLALPGVRLDGQSSCCDVGDSELGFFQTKSGIPVVLQVGKGHRIACCQYPVQRDGKPFAVQDGNEVIVWWLEHDRIVRDRIRAR